MTVVEGDPKAPFTTPRCWQSTTTFLELYHFLLDPYYIIMTVKQSGIKYPVLSLWNDSTWDLAPIARTIRERSTH